MRNGPVRLGHLKRSIPTASKKGLTYSLRALEASGLVVRRDMSESLLHVEYDLARERHDDLESLLDFLDVWLRGYQIDLTRPLLISGDRFIAYHELRVDGSHEVFDNHNLVSTRFRS